MESKLQSQEIVYGKNPVVELLKSGAGVDTVFVSEGMAPAQASYYTALAKQAGAVVKRGETIAKVGATGMATGSHLHFELHHNGVYLNPIYYVSYTAQV